LVLLVQVLQEIGMRIAKITDKRVIRWGEIKWVEILKNYY
jgi:hypothetical protein